jgi:hypothetical protein
MYEIESFVFVFIVGTFLNRLDEQHYCWLARIIITTQAHGNPSSDLAKRVAER